ncbi:MAG: hypothetical protein QM589_07750 [Thermomicrobiales bacterium]
MTEIAKSGWARPESESVIGFAILFLLFTFAGYAIHAHIRAGRLDWLKTGIVGLLFTIAILYGFAVGLWDPYASGPQPTASRQDREHIILPNGAELEPTFTIERPSLEPTHAPEG